MKHVLLFLVALLFPACDSNHDHVFWYGTPHGRHLTCVWQYSENRLNTDQAGYCNYSGVAYQCVYADEEVNCVRMTRVIKPEAQ